MNEGDLSGLCFGDLVHVVYISSFAIYLVMHGTLKRWLFGMFVSLLMLIMKGQKDRGRTNTGNFS